VLAQLQLETGIPVMNGILGCHNVAQAEARATGDNNHGV
jgi:6,7-dimethyl-8-ribityllumazine synthase